MVSRVKKKEIIVFFTILIVGSILLKTLHSRFQAYILRTKERIEEEEERNNLLKNLQSLKKNLEKKKRFVFAKDSSGIIRKVMRIIRDRGLEINSIKPAKSINKQYLEGFYINLNMTCNYFDFLGFIKSLEDLGKSVGIEDLKIKKKSRVSSQEDSQELEIMLTLYSFRIKDTENIEIK